MKYYRTLSDIRDTVAEAPTPVVPSIDQQKIYRTNRDLICHMVGLTDLQYCYVVLEEGYNYLIDQCHSSMASDMSSVAALEVQAFYWRWWTEMWNQRDAEFIAYHELSELSIRDPRAMMAAYTHHHRTAIGDELLCRSFMHLMSVKGHINKVFNHQSK